MTIDDGDGPPTLLRCVQCGGSFIRGLGEQADTCPHCRRPSLTPPQLRRSQARAGGASSFAAFETRMLALVKLLEADNRGATVKLAARAAALQHTFREWQRRPPNDANRNEAFRDAIAVEAAAKMILGRKER